MIWVGARAALVGFYQDNQTRLSRGKVVWVQVLVICKSEFLSDKCTQHLLCSPYPKQVLVGKKLLRAYPSGFFHFYLDYLLDLITLPAGLAL